MIYEDIKTMEYLNRCFLERKLWIVRPVSTRAYNCIFCKHNPAKFCLFCKGKGTVTIREWGYNSVSKIQYVKILKGEDRHTKESIVCEITEDGSSYGIMDDEHQLKFIDMINEIPINTIGEFCLYTDEQLAIKDCGKKNVEQLENIVTRNLKKCIYSGKLL